MCGLTGFWSFTTDDAERVARQMASAIVHRGPDDAGVWLDGEAGIVLAHRRLSIVDLSQAGHQPMLSPCHRYVLVFNGEIYNHQDIRRELEGGLTPTLTHQKGGNDVIPLEVTESQDAPASVGMTEASIHEVSIVWRGHSDTETLLAAISRWGVEQTLKKLNGMFAFALWDRETRSLTLARDRMGEKPLYYGRSGNSFLFGSELKALRVHPHWQGEINRDATALFMRHNYVPAPWSIYCGIFKLPPAHFVTIRDGGRDIGEPRCYWDLAAKAEQGANLASDDDESLTDELDVLLRDAVGRRMMADVPLGAFLSGGYDSTMVVAQMQAQSNRPIQTFTIGFHEEGYNEATHAKAVARHLGTDHTELYVKPEEALTVIPRLPTIYDEPFSDSSQIPTFLVSQLARKHVTVSLSGDGGDELFYGYDRYFRADAIWRKLSYLPMPLRKVASTLLAHAPGAVMEKLMQGLPQRFRINQLTDRLSKLAEIVGYSSGETMYRELVSHWKQPDSIVIGAQEPTTILSEPGKLPALGDFRERMMYLDMMTYLPDDILTKVDRASMAVSLEARVPLLDHRLVEFAWRLPMALKCRDGQGKWLLRQVLDRYVPRELLERPKMGFGVPIEHWLRGPLREWAEALLDETRLRNEGYFDPVPIRRMWEEHLSGKRRWHYYLWDVLMFQAWLDGSQ